MEAKKNESKTVDRIISKTAPTGLSILGGVEAMRKKIDEYEAIRNMVLDYINNNFAPDIDYGQTDDRSDKKTLKKPGAEKLCRMFNTNPVWQRDTESWESAGKPEGTIFMICKIIDNETGNVIGEGRGAAKIGEKARDANKTIKNAEKCAIVDAALYTFMLSEFFTQDEGGRVKAFTLNQWKRALIADVGTIRTGVKSELTDLMWIQKVNRDLLHKATITSLGEHQVVRKAIFEDNKYNLSTGERN